MKLFFLVLQTKALSTRMNHHPSQKNAARGTPVGYPQKLTQLSAGPYKADHFVVVFFFKCFEDGRHGDDALLLEGKNGILDEFNFVIGQIGNLTIIDLTELGSLSEVPPDGGGLEASFFGNSIDVVQIKEKLE